MKQRVGNDRFTIMLLVLALISQTSHSLQICLCAFKWKSFDLSDLTKLLFSSVLLQRRAV